MECEACKRAQAREYHESLDCLGDRDACESAARARCPAHAMKPETFARRAADFVRELQALTKRYGVAVVVYDHFDDGNCGIQLADAPTGGTYETTGDDVTVLDFAPTEVTK